jgi:hypothetical protein
MKTTTAQGLKTWARAHARLAEAVLLAQAFAEHERARVDAYVLPIFKRYRFTMAERWTGPGYEKLIEKPSDLYLAGEDGPDLEAKTAAYYAECDTAHRAHGFHGPAGHCPALSAEHLLIEAEGQLIDAAEPLFGIERGRLYGENRRKYLALLIGACRLESKATVPEMLARIGVHP